MKKEKSFARSLRLGLIVLVALVVYAYGFQVTEVSLAEINSPRRQESLTRVLRALARPEIIKYEQDETFITAPVWVPCPAGGFVAPEPDPDKPYLVITPACAEPRAEVVVEGFNFAPNQKGPLSFIPASQVTLGMGQFETDSDGYFKVAARLPSRPDDVEQTVRAVTRINVGSPMLTQTAIDTWDKIVETVFLALLATTFGVLLAVPVSFVAARNIMKDINSSMAGLALSIISWPAGIWLGGQAAAWISTQSKLLTGSLALTVGSAAVLGVLLYGLLRWSLPQEDTRPSSGMRLVRAGVLLLCGLLGILGLYLTAELMLRLGGIVSTSLPGISFFGIFVNNLGQILDLLVILMAALMGGGVLSGLAGQVERRVVPLVRGQARFGLNITLGALAGATLAGLVGMGLNWLYQFNNPLVYLYWPAAVGAALGISAAVATRKQDLLPVGLAVYYVTRTLLNGLRAIEALIMAIVFAVWVGIGPFAGVLALSLHTIAALAKLYSEQVESIMPGPLEAVKATGANRLQTIVYAVIPQIIPPYISFTMYRWDINVRMSTIIGFAGGGGIGFLLQQNINLLNYRGASAQMLAIAIVVAAMDYLSSYMREKVV